MSSVTSTLSRVITEVWNLETENNNLRRRLAVAKQRKATTHRINVVTTSAYTLLKELNDSSRFPDLRSLFLGIEEKVKTIPLGRKYCTEIKLKALRRIQDWSFSDIILRKNCEISETDKNLLSIFWADPKNTERLVVTKDSIYVHYDGFILQISWIQNPQEKRLLHDIIKELNGSLPNTMNSIYLQSHDELTGILNRTGINHKGELLEQEEETCLIFMIDGDYFKAINDTYGHNIGDEAIKAMAERLQLIFPRETDIVWRYGGDEFIVMYRWFNPNNIREIQIIEQKIQALQEPVSIPINDIGWTHNIQFTFGVSFFSKTWAIRNLSLVHIWELPEANTLDIGIKKADQMLLNRKRERPPKLLKK